LYEFEVYDERARARLAVRPGITGLYQVTARSTVPFSQMLAIDLDYIQRRSLWLDLKIVLSTPWVMLTGKGAG
jgi:lipopolysaccharide/colanic/teichoic acid biosynthesis glycosyltransferase